MTELAARPPAGAGAPLAALNHSLARYAQEGYAVVPDLLTDSEVAGLLHEAAQLCRGGFGPVDGIEPAPEDRSDDEVLRRCLCIHHPHKLAPQIRATVGHGRVVAVLREVIGPDIKSMQSMLFIKSEGKPGQAWHQDEYFIPTRDRSLTGVWIALDDATVGNGCLWVLPGSHRPGILYPDREHDDPRFDCSVEAFDFPYSDGDAVPVELPRGAAVIFNGYLLHRSLPNAAKPGFRRALALHYMNANSLLPWKGAAEDAHVGKADYRDIVLVAGTDPYAWKGTAEISVPHVRPDRAGGCER